MKGINKVILIGNTGKDTGFKTLQDQTPVAKLLVATTETFRLSNGEISSRTDWHTVIAWRGLATFAHQYIKKGALLYVEGKLRNRQYEDKEGQKKYVTEVVADQIVLLDKKEKTADKSSAARESDEMSF